MNSSYLWKIYSIYILKSPCKVLSNNFIDIYTLLKASTINILGKNNIVEISKGNFKRIKIGIHGNNNKIIIKKSTYIRNLEIIIQGDNHSITVDEGTEIGGANLVCCGESTSISIGKNNLWAHNIELRTCDGHDIILNNKVINQEKSIVIANHVWLAENVKILKGVSIAEDSVVGMNSLVTSNVYPQNVIMAGNPAKVIKNNISWKK